MDTLLCLITVWWPFWLKIAKSLVKPYIKVYQNTGGCTNKEGSTLVEHQWTVLKNRHNVTFWPKCGQYQPTGVPMGLQTNFNQLSTWKYIEIEYWDMFLAFRNLISATGYLIRHMPNYGTRPAETWSLFSHFQQPFSPEPQALEGKTWFFLPELLPGFKGKQSNNSSDHSSNLYWESKTKIYFLTLGACHAQQESLGRMKTWAQQLETMLDQLKECLGSGYIHILSYKHLKQSSSAECGTRWPNLGTYTLHIFIF